MKLAGLMSLTHDIT